jgi:hypothetical protein
MLNYEVSDNISMKSNFREIVSNVFLILTLVEISKENNAISLHGKRDD